MMEQQKLRQEDERPAIRITDHWFAYADDVWKFLALNDDGKVTWIRFISDRTASGRFNAMELKILKQLRPMFYSMASEDRETFTLAEKARVLRMIPGFDRIIPEAELNALGEDRSEPASRMGNGGEFMVPATGGKAKLAGADGESSLAEMIGSIDLDAAVALYRKFDEAKRKLATEDDIQDAGNRKFYKKSFWRKVRTTFGVDANVISVSTYRYNTETICRVTAQARFAGRSVMDIGVCSSSEFTGKRTFNVPDLEATAATRALNRVISDAVGGGEVSAEEVQQ